MKAAPQPKNKSTTGRILLRALERIAPGWLEQKALSQFGHPRRPRVPREPAVPGARKFNIEAAGQSLMAWEWGEGPTVLLVHGWSGYSGQMQHFVPPLLKAGFHVVAIDLPAHGQSEGHWLTLPALADTLASVFLRLRPHAVVSHSFGAAASALALREGFQPKKVLLIAPPVEMETFVRRSVEAAGLSPARADGMLRRIEKVFGPISQFDLRVVSTRLSTPAVLVHDRGDDEVPFALLEQVSKTWPKSQLVETTGYGHSGHLRAEAFCEATTAFILGKTKTLEFPFSTHETEPRLRSVREKVKTLAEAVAHSTAR